MLPLFEGSLSYRQRRNKVVKPLRRRIASGGNGPESGSEASIGLRYIDGDLGAGPSIDAQQNAAVPLLPDQLHRTLNVQEHADSVEGEFDCTFSRALPSQVAPIVPSALPGQLHTFSPLCRFQHLVGFMTRGQKING